MITVCGAHRVAGVKRVITVCGAQRVAWSNKGDHSVWSTEGSVG